MCNFVIPVRTCSKCFKRDPLFDEKERSVDGKNEPTYMEPAQDCYSRWCAFSSEHHDSCISCWLTCKHTYGKARKIQGGSPSYVCCSCASCPPQHCLMQPPSRGNNVTLRLKETRLFNRLTRSST